MNLKEATIYGFFDNDARRSRLFTIQLRSINYVIGGCDWLPFDSFALSSLFRSEATERIRQSARKSHDGLWWEMVHAMHNQKVMSIGCNLLYENV